MAEWAGIGVAVALKAPEIIGNLRKAVQSKKSFRAAEKQQKDFAQTVKSVKAKIEGIDPQNSRAIPQELVHETNKLIAYSEARIQKSYSYFRKYYGSWAVRFVHFAAVGFGKNKLEKYATSFDVCADWLNIAGTTVVLYAAQARARESGDNLHHVHENLSIFLNVTLRRAECYRANHPQHMRGIEANVNLEPITRFAYTIVRVDGGGDLGSPVGTPSPPLERERRRLRRRQGRMAQPAYNDTVPEPEPRYSGSGDRRGDYSNSTSHRRSSPHWTARDVENRPARKEYGPYMRTSAISGRHTATSSRDSRRSPSPRGRHDRTLERGSRRRSSQTSRHDELRPSGQSSSRRREGSPPTRREASYTAQDSRSTYIGDSRRNSSNSDNRSRPRRDGRHSVPRDSSDRERTRERERPRERYHSDRQSSRRHSHSRETSASPSASRHSRSLGGRGSVDSGYHSERPDERHVSSRDNQRRYPPNSATSRTWTAGPDDSEASRQGRRRRRSHESSRGRRYSSREPGVYTSYSR